MNAQNSIQRNMPSQKLHESSPTKSTQANLLSLQKKRKNIIIISPLIPLGSRVEGSRGRGHIGEYNRWEEKKEKAHGCLDWGSSFDGTVCRLVRLKLVTTTRLTKLHISRFKHVPFLIYEYPKTTSLP